MKQQNSRSQHEGHGLTQITLLDISVTVLTCDLYCHSSSLSPFVTSKSRLLSAHGCSPLGIQEVTHRPRPFAARLQLPVRTMGG